MLLKVCGALFCLSLQKNDIYIVKYIVEIMRDLMKSLPLDICLTITVGQECISFF